MEMSGRDLRPALRPSRGRGAKGDMARVGGRGVAPWGFAGGVSTHGTHEYRRHPGSIGTNMTPGRTLPNLRMGGQYGNETVSTLNLRVARIDAEQHLLFLEGGVPGAKDGVLLVRQTVKAKKKSSKA